MHLDEVSMPHTIRELDGREFGKVALQWFTQKIRQYDAEVQLKCMFNESCCGSIAVS